jgi:hypothetical protein
VRRTDDHLWSENLPCDGGSRPWNYLILDLHDRCAPYLALDLFSRIAVVDGEAVAGDDADEVFRHEDNVVTMTMKYSAIAAKPTMAEQNYPHTR